MKQSQDSIVIEKQPADVFAVIFWPLMMKGMISKRLSTLNSLVKNFVEKK